MTFSTNIQVRFADVDAAAIVFYPRYFEMLNGAVEDWFAHMGYDFRRMHVDLGIGTPTVKLECEFVASSELGDELTITLIPRKIGRTSCAFDFRFEGGDGERLRGSAVLVCMDLGKREAMSWPADLRETMLEDVDQIEV